MKKLLVIDGNSILNRAFYGIRLLTNKDGLYTNAIYGMAHLGKYSQTTTRHQREFEKQFAR